MDKEKEEWLPEPDYDHERDYQTEEIKTLNEK